ncbi:hypothetical protein RND71_016252 [Anisodus tanguticus]|uniref:Uncharacterized protein n=1 Tax=Anisodus tanguticus TaxID=243964 RepID=A0AAE1S861_9SOLA|nr:hypothetical protein RND71_016252 [Anisodus tanguticus]
MSSMVVSSPLNALSLSKLRINSKHSSSPSKALCILSNKISLESSSKSSFMHGDFTFPSPNFSTFVSKSPSLNIITAQTSPLGEHIIYDFQAKTTIWVGTNDPHPSHSVFSQFSLDSQPSDELVFR